MTDNFNLRKYLVENKVTTNSKMLNESYNDLEATPEAIMTYVKLLKNKFGANLGKVIEDELYDEQNMAYDLPKAWNDEEFAKFAKQDLEMQADMDGVDVIDANFAREVVAGILEVIDDKERFSENKSIISRSNAVNYTAIERMEKEADSAAYNAYTNGAQQLAQDLNRRGYQPKEVYDFLVYTLGNSELDLD